MMSDDEEFDELLRPMSGSCSICGDPRFRRDFFLEGPERSAVLARGLVDQARRGRREDAPVRSLQRR